MDCTRKKCMWMWFVIAASPPVAMAQIPQGQTAPPQQQEAPPQQQAADVVATVNGDPITKREVDANLQPQLQGQQVDPQTLQKMEHQVVNQLVESRLVEQYVTENGPAVEQQEIEAVVDRIENQLAAQQIPLPEYLAARGQTEVSFQKRVEGSIAWQKFQQQQLTDENLTQYFRQNQNRFNAESLDQARQEVAAAYVGELWTSIISQMKPKAEIQKAPPPQAPQRPEAPQSAPR